LAEEPPIQKDFGVPQSHLLFGNTEHTFIIVPDLPFGHGFKANPGALVAGNPFADGQIQVVDELGGAGGGGFGTGEGLGAGGGGKGLGTGEGLGAGGGGKGLGTGEGLGGDGGGGGGCVPGLPEFPALLPLSASNLNGRLAVVKSKPGSVATVIPKLYINIDSQVGPTIFSLAGKCALITANCNRQS
jgi:hypothetical protein